MLRTYDRSWLRPDLLAGVTVWAMLVPQGLGYATLAGMPAVAGLYAAFGALLLYWLYEAPLMPARLGAANRVLRSDSSGGKAFETAPSVLTGCGAKRLVCWYRLGKARQSGLGIGSRAKPQRQQRFSDST